MVHRTLGSDTFVLSNPSRYQRLLCLSLTNLSQNLCSLGMWDSLAVPIRQSVVVVAMSFLDDMTAESFNETKIAFTNEHSICH